MELFKLTLAASAFIAVTKVADFVCHRRKPWIDPYDPVHQRIRPEIVRQLGPGRFDNYLGAATLLSIYAQLGILAAISVQAAGSIVLQLIVCIIAATRIRALQEVTHYAVHGALTRYRSLGLSISDWFFQIPMFKPRIRDRVTNHVYLHHPNVNDPSNDPNLADYSQLGFTPPLSRRLALSLFLYPLTPRGLLSTIAGSVSYARRSPIASCAACLTLCGWLYICGGLTTVLTCYFVPLITFYPLLSWWSQIVEHRWFRRSPNAAPDGEYESGRVLDCPPFHRFLLELTVLPFGDSLHLAHSLYPSVRWNYLPWIHEILLVSDAKYKGVSIQRIWGKSDEYSVLNDMWSNFVKAPGQRL